MNLRVFDLGKFMDEVGSSGVTMMVRIDDERQREGRRPWTVFLAGESLRSATSFRSDCRSLEECIDVAVRELDGPLGARLGSILESATNAEHRPNLLAQDIDDLF